MHDKYLKTPEAAEYVGIPYWAMNKLRINGKINAERCGRLGYKFLIEDLNAYIDSKRTDKPARAAKQEEQYRGKNYSFTLPSSQEPMSVREAQKKILNSVGHSPTLNLYERYLLLWAASLGRMSGNTIRFRESLRTITFLMNSTDVTILRNLRGLKEREFVIESSYKSPLVTIEIDLNILGEA